MWPPTGRPAKPQLPIALVTLLSIAPPVAAIGLVGAVSDKAGKPLPGVMVAVTSASAPARATKAFSDAQGRPAGAAGCHRPHADSRIPLAGRLFRA